MSEVRNWVNGSTQSETRANLEEARLLDLERLAKRYKLNKRKAKK